jgi:hypothetical protein
MLWYLAGKGRCEKKEENAVEKHQRIEHFNFFKGKMGKKGKYVIFGRGVGEEV